MILVQAQEDQLQLRRSNRVKNLKRQNLLKDKRINLPEDVENSLKNYDDLRGGGDQNMDPLKIFENYYERDKEVLGTLDGIIDTAENEFKAADTFLSMENNFKPKKIKTVDEYAEDGDLDPGGRAEGGRPGKGLYYLMGI